MRENLRTINNEYMIKLMTDIYGRSYFGLLRYSPPFIQLFCLKFRASLKKNKHMFVVLGRNVLYPFFHCSWNVVVDQENNNKDCQWYEFNKAQTGSECYRFPGTSSSEQAEYTSFMCSM